MNAFPPVTPEQVTIAVTVFSRRQYIKRAVASALNQTRPVRVIVVEDCGPDATLQGFVKAEFGDRIEYFRNPRRHGLFDNWNVCVGYCRTAWLSILHDDDYLAPNFVESMVKLAGQQPGCGFYYGHYKVVDETGKEWPEFGAPPIVAESQRIALRDVFQSTPIAFAGAMFSAEAVRNLGGFNPHSQFAGDWEMWSKLIAHNGGAATRDHVSYVLGHCGVDRGSTVVERTGKTHVLNYVQRKRIIALLKQQGIAMGIDRKGYQSQYPISTRLLLKHGATMPRRLLSYNVRLLKLSKSPHWRHAAFKWTACVLGSGFVRRASRIWNRRR